MNARGLFAARPQQSAVTDPLQPYRNALRWHGPTFDVLLWRSPESQARRFEALEAMLPLSGRRVGDLGCGRADLLAWFNARSVSPAAYVGVEALPELLGCDYTRLAGGAAEARGVRVRFEHADFAADPLYLPRIVREHALDTLVFGGSLNTFPPRQAKRVLDIAWNAIEHIPGAALLFNFLSDRYPGPPEPGPTYRFDTLGLLRWAMDRSPLVALRQDYLADHDATIMLRVPTRQDLALP